MSYCCGLASILAWELLHAMGAAKNEKKWVQGVPCWPPGWDPALSPHGSIPGLGTEIPTSGAAHHGQKTKKERSGVTAANSENSVARV